MYSLSIVRSSIACIIADAFVSVFCHCCAASVLLFSLCGVHYRLCRSSHHQPSELPTVLANLLALEKKTRLAADARSTVTVATAILDACWQCKDYKALNEHISILTKRRAQLQKVIEAVIQTGAKRVKEIDASTAEGEKNQRELIDTLRTVSAGKMFVELERAQLTKILADMEERAGRVKEAADILQEIQVETIGSMEALEKAHYLLEQVRLMLQKRDYVRTEIIAKKIQTKQFNDPELKKDERWQKVKVKFYQLMIQYHQHFAHYLEITKAYREVSWETVVAMRCSSSDRMKLSVINECMLIHSVISVACCCYRSSTLLSYRRTLHNGAPLSPSSLSTAYYRRGMQS